MIETAVRSLTPEDFLEVDAAVDAHVAAMEVERQAQKKTSSGAAPSNAISTSPAAAAGATNGSPDSMLMSTTS